MAPHRKLQPSVPALLPGRRADPGADREEIFAVIDEIAGMVQAWRENYDLEFQPSSNVTGGEPFLRPDFFAILEKMAAIGFKIYVLSNGTLITPERARRLAALPEYKRRPR